MDVVFPEEMKFLSQNCFHYNSASIAALNVSGVPSQHPMNRFSHSIMCRRQNNHKLCCVIQIKEFYRWTTSCTKLISPFIFSYIGKNMFFSFVRLF